MSELAPVLPDAVPSAPAPAAPPPADGAPAAPVAPAAAEAAAASAPAHAPATQPPVVAAAAGGPWRGAHTQYHPGGAAVVWYAGAEGAASSGGVEMEGRVASMEAELETLAREQAARDDDLRKRVAAALSLASNASRDSAAVCSALQELERLLHPSVRPPPPTPLPPAPQPHQQQPMGLWFPPPPTTPLHMYAAQSPARYFPEVAAAPSWGQPQPHYAFPQPTWQPPQPSWQPPVADGGWFPPGFPERFPDGVAAPGDGEGFQGGRVGQGPAPSVHLRMWLDRVTSEKPFGERAGAARA